MSTLDLTAAQKKRLLAPIIPHACTVGHSLPILEYIRLTAGDGYVIAGATDRYTLAYQRVAVEGVKDGDFDVLMHASEAKVMVSPTMLRLWRTLGRDPMPINLEALGKCEITVDSYPDMRGAVFGDCPDFTTGINGDHHAFSATYLARLKIAEEVSDLGSQPVRFFTSGKRQARIAAIGDDFIFAIMPASHPDGDKDRPAIGWLKW